MARLLETIPIGGLLVLILSQDSREQADVMRRLVDDCIMCLKVEEAVGTLTAHNCIISQKIKKSFSAIAENN